MRPRPSLLLLALLASGCRTPPAPVAGPDVSTAEDAARPIRLSIVATNDLHGWVQPRATQLADGSALEEGGVAAFGGYVKILREDNPGGVILLDAGDLFQGTLVANLSEGAVVIDAMNHLGYAAAAIGNHEFDYGPVGPLPTASGPGMDPFGALKARLAQAKFPILSGNIYEASSGDRPSWLGNVGMVIAEVKGVRVGIAGLVTPTTPMVTNPINVSTLRFGSLAPEAERAARELRRKGAEVVIAIVHAGGFCKSLANPRDLSSCDSTGEIFEMLDHIPPGTFDAVLAGHTHTVLGHWVNGMPMIQDGAMGRAFGVVELFVDRQSRKVLADRTAIQAGIPICEQFEASLHDCDGKRAKEVAAPHLVPATFLGKEVHRDLALEKLIQPALEKVAALQQEKLGLEAPQPITRNYEAESALGSLLADALRDLDHADVALLNSGGLRADLPAGPVHYGDVYEILPFDNTVATLVITGEELKRMLLAAYGAKKGVFQQSGLKVVLDKCPGQGRLKSFTLADGAPIRPDGRYKVVMPDFLARGGDGLAPVMDALPHDRVDLGDGRPLNFRDAVVDYFRRKGKALAPPPSGRTVLVDSGQACPRG